MHVEEEAEKYFILTNGRGEFVIFKLSRRHLNLWSSTLSLKLGYYMNKILFFFVIHDIETRIYIKQ